jgi:hypothetical protein
VNIETGWLVGLQSRLFCSLLSKKQKMRLLDISPKSSKAKAKQKQSQEEEEVSKKANSIKASSAAERISMLCGENNATRWRKKGAEERVTECIIYSTSCFVGGREICVTGCDKAV